ncbi:hypothetical protein VULLAG_LOCUS4586 [Vulpes lagopus]
MPAQLQAGSCSSGAPGGGLDARLTWLFDSPPPPFSVFCFVLRSRVKPRCPVAGGLRQPLGVRGVCSGMGYQNSKRASALWRGAGSGSSVPRPHRSEEASPPGPSCTEMSEGTADPRTCTKNVFSDETQM